MRVQRLARKRDRAQMSRTVCVALLADQRVPPQARLDANLIAPAGDEGHLHERRAGQPLDNAVAANGFFAAGIARAGFLLNQRLRVPRKRVAPRAGGRRGVPVDDRLIDTLRLAALELLLQRLARRRSLCEDDQAGSVAIDPVHHERPPPPAAPEICLEVLE